MSGEGDLDLGLEVDAEQLGFCLLAGDLLLQEDKAAFFEALPQKYSGEGDLDFGLEVEPELLLFL